MFQELIYFRPFFRKIIYGGTNEDNSLSHYESAQQLNPMRLSALGHACVKGINFFYYLRFVCFQCFYRSMSAADEGP